MEDYIRKKDIEILNGYKILAKLSGMNGWQGCCPKCLSISPSEKAAYLSGAIQNLLHPMVIYQRSFSS